MMGIAGIKKISANYEENCQALLKKIQTKSFNKQKALRDHLRENENIPIYDLRFAQVLEALEIQLPQALSPEPTTSIEEEQPLVQAPEKPTEQGNYLLLHCFLLATAPRQRLA